MNPSPNFTIRWEPAEARYVARCDTRPVLAAYSADPEDALADLVWILSEEERRAELQPASDVEDNPGRV